MNSENSKSSDHFRLFINLPDKKNEKEVINMLLCETVAYTIHRKI